MKMEEIFSVDGVCTLSKAYLSGGAKSKCMPVARPPMPVSYPGPPLRYCTNVNQKCIFLYRRCVRQTAIPSGCPSNYILGIVSTSRCQV